MDSTRFLRFPASASFYGSNWRGEWDADTEYSRRDAVGFGGRSFIALLDNQGAEPPSTGTSSETWSLQADRGTPGPQGPPSFSKDVAVLAPSAAVVWTNMPAAAELFGRTANRCAVDLTGATQARVTARVETAGAAAALLRLQYSTDGGTIWVGALSLSGDVNIGAVGQRVGAWANLAAGAKADVTLRLTGNGGDGVISPSFGNILVSFR